MKKLLSCALALLLLFAVAMPVFAEKDDFVGSIEAKGAPDYTVVSVPDGMDGYKVVVIPLSEAAADSEVKKVYGEMSANGYDLTKAFGDAAKGMIVKDLFEIYLEPETANKMLEGDGTTITVNFKLGVPAGEKVLGFTYNDGKWNEIAKCENKGDGSVDATYEHFCPCAFLISETAAKPADPIPTTGDNRNLVIWSVVMVAAVAGIAALAIVYRRKSVKG